MKFPLQKPESRRPARPRGASPPTPMLCISIYRNGQAADHSTVFELEQGQGHVDRV